MQVAFIIDPLSSLQVHHDTTVAIMAACQQEGYEVYTLTISDLYFLQGEPWGHLSTLKIYLDQNPWYQCQHAKHCPLREMNVVWMRKDPPVDTAYLYTTHLLDLIPSSTLVLNSPNGLRKANEKLFALQFKDWIPRTLVSSKKEILRNFVESEQKAILKPLGGKGGEGILRLNWGDPNINSLLEMSTQAGQIPVMIQEYLPEAQQGDKRILLLEGIPLGAVNRVPGSGDFRGNIAAGGRVEKTMITPREKAMCAALAPTLQAEGLYFVGIDVIGERLTEINVTSPTMLQEISQLEGSDLARHVALWLGEKVAALT
jgi:glutathione synthase